MCIIHIIDNMTYIIRLYHIYYILCTIYYRQYIYMICYTLLCMCWLSFFSWVQHIRHLRCTQVSCNTRNARKKTHLHSRFGDDSDL